MNEEVQRAVGARLKEFRVSMGMLQEDMAAEVGVKRQSVSSWENGRTMPSGGQWFKLGQLGMSLDYVVLGIRNVPVSRYAAKYLALPVREAVTAEGAAPDR